MGLFGGFTRVFDGFLEPDEVIVFETEEARVQRLERDTRFLEAQALDMAERTALEYQKKLADFIGEGDGGTYREPPRTDQDLLRVENSVLRREEAAMRGKVRLWRWLAGIGAGWILADIVRFFW